MKKSVKHIIASGLIGLLSLSYSNVNAKIIDSETGEGTDSFMVKVGESMTPVYDFDINYSNLSFDWVFDYNLGEYQWKPSAQCQPYSTGSLGSDLQYSLYEIVSAFDSSDCSGTPVAINSVEANHTYNSTMVREDPMFHIHDNSENGSFNVNVFFTPLNDYSWTHGRFYNMDSNDDSILDISTKSELNAVFSENDITSYAVPMSTKTYNGSPVFEKRQASISLSLFGDGTSHEAPTANDNIGQVHFVFDPIK